MSAEIAARIPEELLDIIKDGKRFVLFTHIHPDGDALGSLLGTADILRSMGKEVFCYLEEPVSHLYEFLPGCDSVCTDMDEYFKFISDSPDGVVSISLDCGEGDRMGTNKVEFLNNRPFLVIDHHKSHKRFGDYRWVEPNSSSTGEMIYELAQALGIKISSTCAYHLYVAICTDTGSFRYDCTSARTLAVASDLVSLGVRPHEISSHVYDNFTLARLKLMELVLSSLQLYEDNQLAFIFATNSMFEESGASYDDVEGFVDYPRSLSSVVVAVFIKEGRDGMVSVSLRAKGGCDVAEVAKEFDGGGHRNAAGFRFAKANTREVADKVLVALRDALYRRK